MIRHEAYVSDFQIYILVVVIVLGIQIVQPNSYGTLKPKESIPNGFEMVSEHC